MEPLKTGLPLPGSLEALRPNRPVFPLWLFLDYDGTLAEFSPRPNMVEVRPEVVDLARRIAANPLVRLAVVSGRSLEIMRQLLPVPNIFLAGVYGLDILTPQGQALRRADLAEIRPTLEEIKPAWENLISGQEGLFLEDKEWTIALHAHQPVSRQVTEIMQAARRMGEPLAPQERFRWFEDECFLEAAPRQAHKGQAVRYLLGHFPFAAARLLYVGDDDKDAEAFPVVHAFGGANVLVYNPDHPEPPEGTDYQLHAPVDVRKWLEEVVVSH